MLVLGSYTCPQLRHGVPEIGRLYERHKDAARFLMAYIREAHPDGEAWQSTINRREGIRLPEARSVAERGEHAALCRKELAIPYEAALDGLDGKAEAAFSAFPSRVFVIDGKGTVTFSQARSTWRPSGPTRSKRRSWPPRADPARRAPVRTPARRGGGYDPIVSPRDRAPVPRPPRTASSRA